MIVAKWPTDIIAEKASEHIREALPLLPPNDARTASLDGLRGIAILLVIVHNAGSVEGTLDGVPLKLWAIVSNAGWVGVQLFFALSGFLITRILLESKGQAYWLRHFYLRRILRIVPLYYAYLIFVFYVVPHVASLQPLAGNLGISKAWYWLYLANWPTSHNGFNAALPHVWSLAVEEQFYLIWPLVIACASEWMLARVAIGTALVALVTRAGLHAMFPEPIAETAAYAWTISRADAIVVGAFVALSLRHVRSFTWIRDRANSTMVALTGGLVLSIAFQRGFPAGGMMADVVNKPLSSIVSALLVFYCVCGPLPPEQRGQFQRALRWILEKTWLRSIGKYSYAVYLLHMPVHACLREHFRFMLVDGTANSRFAGHVIYTVLVFVVAFLLSLTTWTLIEHPFLSLKQYLPMPVRSLGTAS